MWIILSHSDDTYHHIDPLPRPLCLIPPAGLELIAVRQTMRNHMADRSIFDRDLVTTLTELHCTDLSVTLSALYVMIEDHPPTPLTTTINIWITFMAEIYTGT